MARTAVPHFERLFETERRRLWGLAYRMTGSAADADDVVQETFTRALTHPPAGGERDDAAWRPWLWRIAVNLARDAYRRRRARPYAGPWLPAAVETGGGGPLDDPRDEPAAHDPPEARYDRAESVTYAFLLALEALTPRQRAVLLLCDVFDYSVREVAAALDMTESNVKVTHHRARAAMAAYDRARCRPDAERQARTKAALERLVQAMLGADVGAITALLADDARSLGDGGGRYRAGTKPLVGALKVARFYHALAKKNVVTSAEIRLVNGLPAIVMQMIPPEEGWAPRSVFRVDVDDTGRIVDVHSIVAPDKLRAIRF
jgi:RNA polymerase sigma-70 factor (ECF subfamily)